MKHDLDFIDHKLYSGGERGQAILESEGLLGLLHSEEINILLVDTALQKLVGVSFAKPEVLEPGSFYFGAFRNGAYNNQAFRDGAKKSRKKSLLLFPITVNSSKDSTHTHMVHRKGMYFQGIDYEKIISIPVIIQDGTSWAIARTKRTSEDFLDLYKNMSIQFQTPAQLADPDANYRLVSGQ